ncbi:unnamed protein product [Prunus armeniaca]|uniref:Uncharacterized protein n=1 Tax=Prunus armeniaca TaxID=36596 RepID=A0A6J5VM84_PRUAR|nr:unnamed protein product [Prunus armeniaca]
MGNICGNNADCFKHDEDIRSFDTEVKGKVIQMFDSLNSSGSFPTDLCNYYVRHVRDWNQKSGELVFILQKDIEGVKGKQSQRRRKKNLRFQKVVDEFVHNSREMLDLLSELEKFIKSADKTHKSIEAVVREYFDKQGNPTDDHYKRIAQKLKDLKAGTNNEHFTKSVLPKIERLLNMQSELLKKLNSEKLKLVKKQQITGYWKKTVDMLYIAGGAAMCLCVVATAVLASPSALSIAAITLALAAGAGVAFAGQQWTSSFWKEYQDHLKAEERLVDQMHVSNRAASKGLGNIKHYCEMVADDINSLFDQQDFGNSEKQINNVTMQDIQNKLEPFKEKIKTLGGEVDKCRTELMETRDEVAKAGSTALIKI